MVTLKYREKIVQRPPRSPGPRRGSLKGSSPDPSLLGRRLPKNPPRCHGLNLHPASSLEGKTP